MPYFFFSYANADGGSYMERFFTDLCEAVRVRTAYRADEVGFQDHASIHLGEDWSDELAQALASTRVFVAVCSASYFASDFCGREWQVFADYAAHQRATTPGGVPSPLLPITWAPSDVVPPVAERLQHGHGSLGPVYGREGLHYIMRLSRFRDEYRHFVTRLADRIIEVGRQHQSLGHVPVPDIRAVPNAFTASPTSTRPQSAVVTRVVEPHGGPASATFVPRSRLGPSHVNFVIVAAPSYALSHLRAELQNYGHSAQEWDPYKPMSTQRICVFAQSIASRKDLTSALETAEHSVVDLLQRAREKNQMVVLLVDVWTATMAPYRDVLVEYDGINAPTSSVVVPWSRDDRELVANADRLQEQLVGVFPNNTARPDPLFRTQIRTEEDFERTLEAVLTEAQARIFKVGPVARRAGGDRVVPRPILTPLEQPPPHQGPTR